MDNNTIIRYGFNHGQDLVACNFGDIKITEDMEYDEYLDAVRQLAWEAEENYRQYTPFEFFAHALNEMEDPEYAWDLYDAAILKGVNKQIATLLTEEMFEKLKSEIYND